MGIPTLLNNVRKHKLRALYTGLGYAAIFGGFFYGSRALTHNHYDYLRRYEHDIHAQRERRLERLRTRNAELEEQQKERERVRWAHLRALKRERDMQLQQLDDTQVNK
eukprot:61645_1